MLEAMTRETTSQVRPYMTNRLIDDIVSIGDVACSWPMSRTSIDERCAFVTSLMRRVLDLIHNIK
jgi:hypothetical protein